MQSDKAGDNAAGLQPPNGETPFLRKTCGGSRWGVLPLPQKSPGYIPAPPLLGMVAVLLLLGNRDQEAGCMVTRPETMRRDCNRQAAGCRCQVKSSKEFPQKYIEQEAKPGPSSQFAKRTGSGQKACPSSKELRGLSVRAQVRVEVILLRSLLRGLPQTLSTSRSATSRSASKCNAGSR